MGKMIIHDCFVCNTQHASPTWYGKHGSKVCKVGYERQRKFVKALHLKKAFQSLNGSASWRAKLLPQIDTVDHTGYPISSLTQRSDYKALVVALHALEADPDSMWRSWFYGAFCVFLYWSWPCLAFMSSVAAQCETKCTVANCFDTVVAQMEKFRVVQGDLVPHHIGKCPIGSRAAGRDKDRGNAIPRGRILCLELDEWWSACVKLAEVPKPFSMKAGMEILRTANLDAFHGNNDGYGCLGVLRLLACAIHDNSFADKPEDWDELRNMSPSVRDKLKGLQLWEYPQAMQACKILQAIVDRHYSLCDLVCFVCLSQ